MKVVIINGQGGVGKDTFIHFVRQFALSPNMVVSFSSIDRIVEYAVMFGWDGKKTEKARKFLSDLKQAFISWNDLPFNYLSGKISECIDNPEIKVVFLHIREPEEIKKMKSFLNSVGIYVTTLLIVKNDITKKYMNTADDNVFRYNYDFTIDNNGTLDDLKNMAAFYLEKFLRNELLS